MSGARLRADGLTVRLAGEALPVLSGLDLLVRPGEVVGVCGRSGCGKSTLLHALAGLLPWSRSAEVRGAVVLDGEEVTDLDPGQRAHLLATCLDRPDAQLFLATPRQEMAAARGLHGEAPFADNVARALGLSPLLDRRIVELSSGERQRVALAAALVAAPRPVLLDEPTVHLDDGGVAAFATVLREVRSLGGAVLIAEQAGWRVADGVDRWLELSAGCLRPCAPPVPPAFDPPGTAAGRAVLEASAITLRRGGRDVVRGVTLTVGEGEIVFLSGANGAGKSSLARALAGHAGAAGGALTVAAGRIRRPRETVLLLPEAGVQLFADTVAGELELGGCGAAATAAGLRTHRLEHLAGRAPWTLSRGERQRLLHAALDALGPRLMIVDEPGQGLDPGDLGELARLIAARARDGRAYLVVSHREELARIAHRHLALSGGALVEAGGGE